METTLECFVDVSSTETGIKNEITVYGTTDDNMIWGDDAVYLTARNQSTGDTDFQGDNYLGAGQEYWYGTYSVVRGFLYFDTSSLTTGATLLKANLNLYDKGKDIEGNFDLVIQSGMPTYPSQPSVLSDFDATFYSGNGGSINTGAWLADAPNIIDLNSTGLSWINKTGMTKFCIRSSDDINSTAPSSTGDEINDIIYFYSQENDNIDRRPSLHIEYTTTGERQDTYYNIEGTLLIDDNGSTGLGGTDFNGVRIPCTLNVVRNIIGSYFDVGQGIRVYITVGGEDVSDSIIGNVTINHNINYISTFSFSLGDPKYSPLTDSNIAVNAQVIIKVYINGIEHTLFTGLLDETRTTYDGGYRLQINGRDYGKKLLDKTMTLISVQNSANNARRGSMVEYLAGQAGITSTNIPIGDAVTIDHSFQDQSIWDMIQKECAIEGWYVRFDENNVMTLQTRELKDTADWEYGEDKFIQLGLETSDKGIINSVIILGTIFEEETITQDTVTGDDSWTAEIEWDDPTYDIQTTTISNSFGAGNTVIPWSYTDANFKVTTSYEGILLGGTYGKFKFTINLLNTDLTIQSIDYSISAVHSSIYSQGNLYCILQRYGSEAFTLTIAIKTSEITAGGIEEIEEEYPEETFTSTITYTQVKATVTDINSIALYGERKPNSEGTLEFPLAQTKVQCERIGGNIILDSHRFIKQPDFYVQFNPKLYVGQTVELTYKKIGYDEDKYMVEEVIHTIGVDSKGKAKARTRIGCVYYA